MEFIYDGSDTPELALAWLEGMSLLAGDFA